MSADNAWAAVRGALVKHRPRTLGHAEDLNHAFDIFSVVLTFMSASAVSEAVAAINADEELTDALALRGDIRRVLGGSE